MEKVSAGLSHLFMTVFLYSFATFMVIPAITDVAMSALCPGQDECSLAIYLTGIQQAVVIGCDGVNSVIANFIGLPPPKLLSISGVQGFTKLVQVGERILCRHPFSESKRAYVIPQRVEELLKCFWPGNSDITREELPPLKEIRDRCIKQLEQMRPDHMRGLNPTPYKHSGQHIPNEGKIQSR